MPNRNPGQGQGRQNGGSADRGVREQAQGVGDRIKEGAAQVGQQIRENYEQASQEMAHRYRRAEGMMARNPTQSVLIGFGVGFGLGLVLTTMLTAPDETWAERHLPDRLRNAPDSFHHLAESIRSLPDAIARRIRG
jgi:ElaB/YqjD/DUF883 family membrane-anchored ribosome-binding protein